MSQLAPGEPARADVALLESLRTKLMSLVFLIQQMQNQVLANQTAPPAWPTIHKSIATVSSTINSIQDFINKDPETLATFRALHAFPTSPFQGTDPNMVALIDTIFAKLPGTNEQDWILEKLQKATEFAHVPKELNIEAKRPAEDEDQDIDEDEEGKARIMRQKGNIDEDGLSELWNDVFEIVESQFQLPESPEAADEVMKEVKKEQPMMSLGTIHRFMSTGSVLR